MNVNRIIAPDVLEILQSGSVPGGQQALGRINSLSNLKLPDGALVFSGPSRDSVQLEMKPLYDYVILESSEHQYERRHLLDVNLFLPDSFGRGITDMFFWNTFSLGKIKDHYISLLNIAENEPVEIKVLFSGSPSVVQFDEMFNFLRMRNNRLYKHDRCFFSTSYKSARKILSFDIRIPHLNLANILWLGYNLFSLSYIVPVRYATSFK